MFQTIPQTEDLNGLTSVLVDRIETPEKTECHLAKRTPLAVLKSGNDRDRLVRIVPAFPTKDLLVPVPPDDVTAFVVCQKSDDGASDLDSPMVVNGSVISSPEVG